MNKGKLRSLLFHSGFCDEDGGWDERPLFEQENDNFQRLAELIIRECIDKIETYRIPVGNSAAGELACEWTYDALKSIRDDIKETFGVDE